MDDTGGDRTVADMDRVEKAQGSIPPIDLAESSDIETATFALG